MSMKYYAVTDDPNELLHYGVKGMKWGQHLFGDDLRPKSAGYHRARAKLKKIRSDAKRIAKSAGNAIKVSKQQIAANHQKKREDKYNRAVMKAQQRINAIEGLGNLNQMMNYEREVKNNYTASRNAAKLSAKRERRYAKNEAKMDKYLQQAREGRLKYGKLSEDQVNRITDRLSLERQARGLGSAEKTWHQQKKEARRAGKLQGITRGTASAMEEIAKAGAQFGVAHVIDRWKLNSASKHEGERQHIKTRAQNKKSRSEMREDLQNEAYEAQIREGDSYDWATATAGGKLKKIEAKKHEQQRIQAIQDRMRNEMDLSNEGQYNNALLSGKEQRQIQEMRDQYQKYITGKRDADRVQKIQDRLDDKRDEEFYNTYIGEKGYQNEDSAISGYRNDLANKVNTLGFKYGDKDRRYLQAVNDLDSFDNATSGDKKRIMNAAAANEAKQKAKKERTAVMNKYSQIRAIAANNELIRANNDAEKQAHAQLLKAWASQSPANRGPRPQLTNLIPEKPLPKLSAKELEILQSLGINPYGGGGGGKKKG